MQENTDQKTSQYGHFSRTGRRDYSIVFFAKPFVTLNTPFFYKQFIFDPRPENYLSFSRKSPQKIVSQLFRRRSINFYCLNIQTS